MPARDEEGSVLEDSKPTNKVARLIAAYEFGEAYGAELERLWTADGDERESLRSLAERFNERLLESAMEEAGMSPLDGEVSNLYRLLTSDDVSGGKRVEARNRLEQAGVDLEQVEQDFVSYQAIRSYLKDYRNAEYDDGDSGTRPDTVVETVQRLKSRTQSVAQNSLKQLRNKGAISLGEFRLFVEINVHCEDCNSQYGLVELLSQNGCECDES